MTSSNQVNVRGPAYCHRQVQCGAALIVALVVLLAMTLIGISATQTTVLQERMSGNLRQKEVAFEAAEVSLRVGEDWILGLIGGPRPDVPDRADSVFDPYSYGATGWSDPEVMTISGMGGQLPGMDLAEDPLVYISEVNEPGGSLVHGMHTDKASKGGRRLVFEITARAVGEVDSAESILRSRYAQRF